MRRRDFLAVCAAAPLYSSSGTPGFVPSPFPVKFRQEPSYAAVLAFAEPGSDEFPEEQTAKQIEARLASAFETGDLPLASACGGASPAPSEYRSIAPDVGIAVYDGSPEIASGWRKWRASFGTVRLARFYALPGDLIRYDIRGENAGRVEHRIGIWKQSWKDGLVTHFEPLEETLTQSPRLWFRDVTGAAFAGVASFEEQLTRGVPYWRSRLDPGLRHGRLRRERHRRGRY